MEFAYQKTFLRSALVKDPFSLGDLGPTDVLRIESQFPTLFATVKDISDTIPAPAHKSTLLNSYQPRFNTQQRPTTRSILANKYQCKCSVENNIPNTNPLKSCKSTPTLEKIANLSSNKESRKTSSQIGEIQQRDKLISVDDLKRILEEILFENYNSPRLLHKVGKSLKIDLKPKKTCLKYPFSQNDVDNIDMDEVKKMILKAKTSEKTHQPKNVKMGGGDDKRYFTSPNVERTSNLRHINNLSINDRKSIVASVKTPSLSRMFNSSLQNSQNILRTMSGPGFLRPAILKSSNSTPRQGQRKSVKFAKGVKGKAQTKSYTMEAEVHKQTVNPNAESVNSKVNEEKYITSEPSDSEMMKSRPISVKKMTDQISLLNNNGKSISSSSDPFTSYQQMKLAKNLVTKYEQIGLLKKMQYEQKVGVVKWKKEDTTTRSEIGSLSKQPESRIANLEMVAERTLKPSILEDIAKDLVYIEVVKHLHDLKLKEGERKDNLELCPNIPSKINDSTMTAGLLDVCRNDERLLSVIPEVSEVSLSTPSLTPSSPVVISKQGLIVNGSLVEEDNNSDEVKTPDLTLPSRKSQHRVLKDSPVSNNDNTDCSEISDFIFSEIEIQITPKSTMPNDCDNEIVTPQLSSTSISSKNYNKFDVTTSATSGWRRHNSSTLCSTLSPAKSNKTINKKESTSTKTTKKSDTIPNTTSSVENSKILAIGTEIDKQKGSSISLIMTSKTSQLDKSNYEMLSDGEFIGENYKSPGEMSLSLNLSQGLSPNKSINSTVSISISSDTAENGIPFSDQEVLCPATTVGEFSTGEYLYNM